ncbi:MAG: hypothetical protein HC794_05300 [Nitrospiraceae bacterium]|nr:hypothetical protein [Nitrospiraceae bacterium]
MSPDGNLFETLESFSNGLDAAHPEGGLQVSPAASSASSQAFGAAWAVTTRVD